MNAPRLVTAGAVGTAAVGLAALFWWPLLFGGGLVGGDVYNYFLPQKAVYADRIKHGELPLWNDRVGFGYPIIGESQTGVFYPFNLVCYRFLALNAAYNANFLLHYALAFVFAWMYARTIGLGNWGSGLAALVYTYGWFPPRLSLEWSIITGAWFPLALWCSERLLATRRTRYALILSGVLALQLLAGHYNLAFVTQLTLVPYVALRLFFANRDLPEASRKRSGVLWGTSLAAVVCACGLAALQLAPSWELKRESQRQSPGPNHNLADGLIPVWYWAQAIEPWYWYGLGTNRQAELEKSTAEWGARTNEVESHLFFGLVPLALALAWIPYAIRIGDRLSLVWVSFGLAALFYAAGWFIGLVHHVPGFNFFSGAGRYCLITTLAVGILAGKVLDRLRSTGSLILSLIVLVSFAGAMFTAVTLTGEAQAVNAMNGSPNPFLVGRFIVSDGMMSAVLLIGAVGMIASLAAKWLLGQSANSPFARGARFVLTGCVLLAPTIEFWLVCRVVGFSDLVDDPPIVHRAESPIGKILDRWKGTARVFASSPNLLTVLDTAETPAYLTFGPAAYFDPKFAMPAKPVAKQVDWLRRAGVTHVLSFTPLNPAEWPVKNVWSGIDPFLNPAMARYHEPLFLYELLGSRGRVAWSEGEVSGSSGRAAKITDYRPERVVIEASSSTGGCLLVTNLSDPDWSVAVDGVSAKPLTVEGMFRGVDLASGKHTVIWSYRSRSLYLGMAGSGVTFLCLATLAFVLHRRKSTRNSFDS